MPHVVQDLRSHKRRSKSDIFGGVSLGTRSAVQDSWGTFNFSLRLQAYFNKSPESLHSFYVDKLITTYHTIIHDGHFRF